MTPLSMSPNVLQYSELSSVLDSLNPAQLKAVKYAPNKPVQILAGPGSGKTKVLTSRIAFLILAHSISPSSICAVTFTNKAANEMRERLMKLIGKQRTSEVKMGTFHALCALFLRKHGRLVGLDESFTICDGDESKKIVTNLLKMHKGYLEERNLNVKESTILSIISRAKAKGHPSTGSADFLNRLRTLGQDIAKPHNASDDINILAAEIYDQYEQILRRNNSLDFDDLLLFGVRLFREHKVTGAWCKHILVDEFQDTNVTQYDLMQALAVDRCVTIVGDPDQSIYGWRSAEIGNLVKMQQDFAGTEQILLEENYRSTGAILRASLALVAQDKGRVQKTLRTSHPSGITPVLRSFTTDHEEANFLAIEIKRVVAHMGGVLHWGDFVILLRFSALSRTIESALQKEGIPSKVLGGHKFFERLEIKNILAYLQIVDNPRFDPALVRALNVPSRGIGEKTLSEIALRAEKTRAPQLHVVEGICDGRLPDIQPAAKRKLIPFVKTIRVLRELAKIGTSPADLIHRVVELVSYEDHLRKTQPDWESRWENVQELISFASEIETDMGNKGPIQQEFDNPTDETPLRLFLQASMLSSEGDNQNEDESKEKVTISTCHAAKGLEWPVVMVPAVEQGTFPFYRADDIEEERRLLYVACTRAQVLLYLSHATKRKVAGETKTKDVSEFLSVITDENQTVFTNSRPNFEPNDRSVISNILDRSLPNDLEVTRRVSAFDTTTGYQYCDKEGVPPNQPNEKFPTSFTTSGNVLAKSINDLGHGRRPSNSRTSTPKPFVVRASAHTTTPSIDKPLNENIPPTILLQTTSQVPPRSLPNTILPTQGVKRHLGMGRGGTGYANKKFKPPM